MKIDRCGTCFFGKIVTQDLTKRICWGMPPTAMQVPAPNGQLTLKMARPVVSVSDEACALYRGKSTLDIDRDAEAMLALKAEEETPKLKQ